MDASRVSERGVDALLRAMSRLDARAAIFSSSRSACFFFATRRALWSILFVDPSQVASFPQSGDRVR